MFSLFYRRFPVAASPSREAAQDADVLPVLVARQAAAIPNALAVSAPDATLTYSQLNHLSERLALELVARGVGSGTVVGIYAKRSAAHIFGALAIMKAGAAYMPLDPDLPPARIASMLADTSAPIVATAAPLAQLGAVQQIEIDLNGCATPTQANTPLFTPRPSPADSAYVIFTSGSTGKPKGVEVTHANLSNLIAWHCRTFGVRRDDRASQVAGIGFDAAVWEIWPHLAAGASVFLPDEVTRTSAELLRDWLLSTGITVAFVPTPLAERMLHLAWPKHLLLRFMLTGGSSLHTYPPAGLPFTLVNNYGPTECTVVTTSVSFRANEQAENLPPIGRPIDGAKVYVLDEQMSPVQPGSKGEIYIGGAVVARGYRNAAELTARKFVPDPFGGVGARLYRTGDLGMYLQDGQIAFCGRIDDQIKIRGYRIEPEEIVAALNSHPSIEASAVLAASDSVGKDTALIAYVVAQGSARLTRKGLRDFLAERLPAHMIPAMFVRIGELPVTANGKVDRSALPKPEPEIIIGDETVISAHTAIEQRVSNIVSSLLNLPGEQIALDDNFFLLGGHSLLGAQMIARLRAIFGVELPLRALFESPTIAGLAIEIENLITAAENDSADAPDTDAVRVVDPAPQPSCMDDVAA